MKNRIFKPTVDQGVQNQELTSTRELKRAPVFLALSFSKAEDLFSFFDMKFGKVERIRILDTIPSETI
jgi:hypothetical protein